VINAPKLGLTQVDKKYGKKFISCVYILKDPFVYVREETFLYNISIFFWYKNI